MMISDEAALPTVDRWRKRRAVIVLTVLCAAIVMSALAAVSDDDLDDVVRMVQTPEDLERFYKRDFSVDFIIPSKSKPPEETLRDRAGNCEDFARLTQAVLFRMGIDCEVVYIKFRNMNIGHAVCVWKENSFYYFFDNKDLVKTTQTSVQSLMSKYYYDMECCTVCESVFDVEQNICI